MPPSPKGGGERGFLGECIIKNNPIYKQVYFRSIRRAMLENETLMTAFMDSVAVNYSIEEIERLGRLMIAIFDNDLFDLLMGHKAPEAIAVIYGDEFLNILQDIGGYSVKK
ncbi:MAG: succinate dehydrogenase assembly factor 2 [Deferribacteraceae bacterium]|nr:succinate dehydrogenase assembly factor 2 [Deferribacteraceae bacterium]